MLLIDPLGLRTKKQKGFVPNKSVINSPIVRVA